MAESRLERTLHAESVDLLIERGVVLPMTGEHDLFWDGAVAIDDGRIIAVGATADLREAYDAKETIDAHEQLVMPGLVNTHMHLFGAFARGLVNDLSFTPWIQKKFYVTSKGLNPDNYYLGTQFTSIEMLKTGTTAFLDCGTYQELEEAAVRGVETAGLRAVLARAMADVQDDLAEFLTRSDTVTRENLEHAERFIDTYDRAADGRVRAWPCPIQVTSSSDELCVGSMDLAERFDVGVVTHSNVDREDIEAHELRFGSRPIERFNSLGILNHRFVGTHMAWLSDKEVNLLEATGAGAIHCPSASMKGAYGALSKGRYPGAHRRRRQRRAGHRRPRRRLLPGHVPRGPPHRDRAQGGPPGLDADLALPGARAGHPRLGPRHAHAGRDRLAGAGQARRRDPARPHAALDGALARGQPARQPRLLGHAAASCTACSWTGACVVRGGEVLTMDEGEILRAMQKEAPRFVKLAREWDANFWPQDHTKPHVFKRVTPA